jgi:hypothetical protein
MLSVFCRNLADRQARLTQNQRLRVSQTLSVQLERHVCGTLYANRENHV